MHITDLDVGSYALDTEIVHANGSAYALRSYFSVSTLHLSSMKYLGPPGVSMQPQPTSASPQDPNTRRNTFPVPPDAFAATVISDSFAAAIDKVTGESIAGVTVISFHIGPCPCVCIARGGEVSILLDMKTFFRNRYFQLNLANRNEGFQSSLVPLMSWLIRAADARYFDFGVMHFFSFSHERWWFDDLAREFTPGLDADGTNALGHVGQWILAGVEPTAATAATYLTGTQLTGARVLVSVASGTESTMIMYKTESLQIVPAHPAILQKVVVSQLWSTSAFELLALAAADLFEKDCDYVDRVCRSRIESDFLVSRASVLASFGKIRTEWQEYLNLVLSEPFWFESTLDRQKRWSTWGHDIDLVHLMVKVIEDLKQLSNISDSSISLHSQSNESRSFSLDILASAEAMLEFAVWQEFGKEIDSSTPLVVGGVVSSNLRLVNAIRERSGVSDVRVIELSAGSLSALGGLWTVVPPPLGSNPWSHRVPSAMQPFLIPLRSWHASVKPVQAKIDACATSFLLQLGAMLGRARNSQALSEHPSWQSILSLPLSLESAKLVIGQSSPFWFEKLTLLVPTWSDLACCCSESSAAGLLTPYTTLACAVAPKLLESFGWVQEIHAGIIHVKAVSSEVDPWLVRVIEAIQRDSGLPGIIEGRLWHRNDNTPMLDPAVMDALGRLPSNKALTGVIYEDVLYSTRHTSISRLLDHSGRDCSFR